MQWRWLFALPALLGACGRSVRHEALGSGGANGAAGEAGGGATSGYAPSNPNVPAEGDGQLPGGSFEGPPVGDWQFCSGQGVSTPSGMPAGSDGASFLVIYFCEACPDSENDIGVALRPTEPLSAGKTLYLYFDIKDFELTPPKGELTLGGVHAPASNPCKSDEVLASIPLAELALTTEWQTRCVSITPLEPILDFGPNVSDRATRIAVDALRFGPPCHE